MWGEIISIEVIEIIKGYIKNNKSVIGLYNNLIKVIKDN